jgi:hypothetical protein
VALAALDLTLQPDNQPRDAFDERLFVLAHWLGPRRSPKTTTGAHTPADSSDFVAPAAIIGRTKKGNPVWRVAPADAPLLVLARDLLCAHGEPPADASGRPDPAQHSLPLERLAAVAARVFAQRLDGVQLSLAALALFVDAHPLLRLVRDEQPL